MNLDDYMAAPDEFRLRGPKTDRVRVMVGHLEATRARGDLHLAYLAYRRLQQAGAPIEQHVSGHWVYEGVIEVEMTAEGWIISWRPD